MNKHTTDIPIIGIVLKNGEVESYDYKTAANNNFHHSFIVTSKGISALDYDESLRFVKIPSEDFYTLEGEPSLEPFTTGKKQVIAFASHCIERGIDPNTKVKIKDHKLNTFYEDSIIGRLKDFAPK
jgi:hypothetical protein